MQQLQRQFQQLNRQSGSMTDILDRREQGFSLFAFLEQNADESSVKEYITYMKPSATKDSGKLSQSRVEMNVITSYSIHYTKLYDVRTADACFIATASFGTLLHPCVRTLRDFRDSYLMHSSYNFV